MFPFGAIFVGVIEQRTPSLMVDDGVIDLRCEGLNKEGYRGERPGSRAALRSWPQVLGLQ